MKNTTRILLLSVLLYPATAHALYPLLDHIDIDPRYDFTTNRWTWVLMAGGINEDPSAAYMPARDVAPNQGERNERPEGGEWDFLGVDAGQPLWIFSEYSSNGAWLGFADTQVGLKDPLKFSLVDVEGPAGGNFSLYRVISGTPVVFMSTVDGIGASDFYEKPEGHHHTSWGFSKKGLWSVRLRVSAVRTAGNTPTVAGPTDSTRLFFAIGERAAWRASNFDAQIVMDESIAGAAADPDHDGWSNLVEYAFGTNPNVPGFTNVQAGQPAAPKAESVLIEGMAYPAISFLRRKNPGKAELEYAVEWQSGLANDAWTSGGVEHSVVPAGVHWDRVTVRDTSPAGTHARFARVRITGLD